MPAAEREWLSVSAAAKRAGVAQSVVRAAVNAGKLPMFAKPGESRRRCVAAISAADVDAWVRSQPRATFGADGIEVDA